MIYIGIDPATACGYAVLQADGKRIASGTWQLKRKHESAGMRYIRLQKKLSDLLDTLTVEAGDIVLGYEQVARHNGTAAAHIYGGLVATLQVWCESVGIEYTAIPVGQIKRTATGKGNANKQMMIDAAEANWSLDGIDDNEADALWIAEHVRQELGPAQWLAQ
jgi:Holliday junction resolvasome RuvABC endonuclease subunit